MGIYTRYGSELVIKKARVIPVWIEHQGFRIRWHYKAKKPTRLTKEMNETPVWHVTADYKESGDACCDGRWLGIALLVADDGWKEIEAELKRVNPGDVKKLQEWHTSTEGVITQFFDLEDEKNIQ